MVIALDPATIAARSGVARIAPRVLRLDPDLHDALARWAADELRSTNAHVEYLLRRAATQAGRLSPGS